MVSFPVLFTCLNIFAFDFYETIYYTVFGTRFWKPFMLLIQWLCNQHFGLPCPVIHHKAAGPHNVIVLGHSSVREAIFGDTVYNFLCSGMLNHWLNSSAKGLVVFSFWLILGHLVLTRLVFFTRLMVLHFRFV